MDIEELNELLEEIWASDDYTKRVKAITADLGLRRRIKRYQLLRVEIMTDLAQVQIYKSGVDPDMWARTKGPMMVETLKCALAVTDDSIHIAQSERQEEIVKQQEEVASKNLLASSQNLRVARRTAIAAGVSAAVAAIAVGVQIWTTLDRGSRSVTLQSPISLAPVEVSTESTEALLQAAKIIADSSMRAIAQPESEGHGPAPEDKLAKGTGAE